MSDTENQMPVAAATNCSAFHVGQAVTPKYPLGDAPSEESPGGTYASRGEKLIIRRIGGGTFPISVSHEDRDGTSFGVKPEEIEPLPNVPSVPSPTETPSQSNGEQ